MIMCAPARSACAPCLPKNAMQTASARVIFTEKQRKVLVHRPRGCEEHENRPQQSSCYDNKLRCPMISLISYEKNRLKKAIL